MVTLVGLQLADVDEVQNKLRFLTCFHSLNISTIHQSFDFSINTRDCTVFFTNFYEVCMNKINDQHECVLIRF